MRALVLTALVSVLGLGAAHAQTIDGAALAGPPPGAESAQAAADRLAMRPAVSEQRLAQARADLAFDPWLAFRPALGEAFASERLPQTARVLAATTDALRTPINAAKAAYDRPRPFAADRSVLQCDEPGPNAGAGGSYPSGHAAAGWAWALILAELAPAHADAILQRGRDFGESRVICGYHFPSDVEASQRVAAGVVARLHAQAGFRSDLEAARRELARALPAN